MAGISNKHTLNSHLKRKVFVGLSGGVDSAVAAALLKKRGLDVTGVFLREYDLSMSKSMRDQIACTQEDDRANAIAVAAHLDIPFEEWDFRHAYKKHVVDYLFDEYAAGGTPNPDVMCNKHIKFGLFLERALKRGADFIATGHYAKVRGKRLEVRGLELRIAKDTNKDQTYFLYTLTQAQLARCLFPLGDMTKPEVRTCAKSIGLPNWNRKDSQGVCFIGNIAMKDFLQTKLKGKKGLLMTSDGDVVGTHDGARYYTTGQRHGIGAGGGSEPYYVTGKDMKKNIVFVARGEKNPELFKKELVATQINWISGTAPALPFRCKARIRYRQPLENCRLEVSGARLEVGFEKPQRAVTPGQAIVFYTGATCLGGGIIGK